LNGVVLSNLAYLSQCACKQLTGSDADVIAVGLGRQPAFNFSESAASTQNNRERLRVLRDGDRL
jgi:hypothetical protein